MPNLIAARNSVMLLLILTALGCAGSKAPRGESAGGGKPLFNHVDTCFTTTTLMLPEEYRFDILFGTGDSVYIQSENRFAPAKDKNDYMTFIPLDGSSEEGWLWVNHETIAPDSNLGDGGGATMIQVKFTDGKWTTIGNKIAVDFSNVGGTWHNCLGTTTPWGTILTGEEYEPGSNAALAGLGWRDTLDIGGYKKHLNYGWVVEVDPVTKKAKQKLWQMGRFSHEGMVCMPDRKTVYMIDDYAPGIFFKFVATRENDLTSGQLYAWKQTPAGGEWIALPMQRQYLNFAREVAIRMGATFLMRPEGIVIANDGSFYISETGISQIDLSVALRLGGIPAEHLLKLDSAANVYCDKFGRILNFNPITNTMTVYLEGGSPDNTFQIHLSNPDNLSYDPSRNLLVIHEDILEPAYGRIPQYATGALRNEIYMMDLSDADPSLSDLKRFANAPAGAETTGGCWTPDHKTYFFNVQSPLPTNPPPFNRSMTVAVTGF
jgi:uncharacterized protein